MQEITPPIAKKIGHTTNYHNTPKEDPYFYMRNRESEEVLDYLKAENAYTEAKMEHTKPLQKLLFDEFLGRIKETDLSVPIKDEQYFYYTRSEEGKSYSIHCRKKDSLEAEEEIILDENILAKGLDYFSLGDYEISDNHNLLAYSVDTNGSEKYTIFIKDLQTGELLTDKIVEVDGNVVWANDHKTFFYVRMDDTMRPYQLYRHVIGNSTDQDVLVYEEEDSGFYLGCYKTKSNAYLFILLGSKITHELHYLDANNPEGEFQLFAERKKGIEYMVDHHSDYFYILTNENALNFKLLKTPTDKVASEHWTEVFPYDKNVKLDSIELFKEYLVVYGRKEGLKNITIQHIPTQEVSDIEFPESVYTYWDDDNPDFNNHKIRLIYSSMVTPRTVYDYNMKDKKFEFLKEYEVLGGYDRTKYEMKRLFATAEDGTLVPMSVMYKKGLDLDSNNPCYLYAYGSYGYPLDPSFSSTRFSLLERGFVYVFAHIRGGGEMGRYWYENGKYLNKKNTFTDLIACAEHLIKEKYTSSDKLVTVGGSAGGLLMGAVANLRPDLFHAVVAHVPFVDVINTMMDESIPLTVMEYEEWGNPNDKAYYDYMLSYSPYDNVEAKEYPKLLVTAGLNDPRVQYWEPTKWTAKLRDTKTDENILLLKVHMGAGHAGKSGRYGYLEDLAFEYAFLFHCLEIAQ